MPWEHPTLAKILHGPHPKSLSQFWARDFDPSPLAPFSQGWEKGLGDEGQVQKWDAPDVLQHLLLTNSILLSPLPL